MTKAEGKEITKILSDIDSQLSMFLLENTAEDYGEIESIDYARERINDVIMMIDAKSE